MRAIYKKEMRQYLTSFAGAVFLAAYAALIGYQFTVGNLLAQSGEISGLFSQIMSMLMFLVPILTMRLLSEEKKMRTDQLLLTSPVTIGKIVMGKFLAALSMFVIGSIPLAAAAGVMWFYGVAFTLETAGNFAGLLLAGAAFIAIGLFASAITENQIVAAIVSYVVMIGLWLLDYLRLYVSGKLAGETLRFLSVRAHAAQLASGIFSLSTLICFLGLTALMLGLTKLVMESRRCR